ncbi:hypothetical protein LWC34_41945 [Kibdelosporangium philippinense]|uniref:Uncharacterized protein n=1 Tax=Kibdelosporangium philippinense TaxID=211113 RepID=A0ABS8ZSC7_9PSEU|nr:hypothetical protein [Kibdelosporangium philippinense]MCE7009333.1 hypothetical protein [Kibdelosporangium philippinense]
MIPATDLEAVVIGVLMQLSPDTAERHLNRLEPGDFTDWRAATVAGLLADMITAGLSSVDPAAIVGYALRTGAIPGEHKLKRVAEWMADAYTLPWHGGDLGYHIDLLIEASYRRHVVIYAKRLLQAETDGALDLLDGQITTGYAGLAAQRQRFTTRPFTPEGITRHERKAA